MTPSEQPTIDTGMPHFKMEWVVAAVVVAEDSMIHSISSAKFSMAVEAAECLNNFLAAVEAESIPQVANAVPIFATTCRFRSRKQPRVARRKLKFANSNPATLAQAAVRKKAPKR